MLPSWFKPYAGPPSRAQDGAGNVFLAQLGSREGDKATFHVYVFKIAPDGTVEEVSLINPPKNHSSLSEAGDTLVLCGERDGVVQEWAVAGWVAKRSSERPAPTPVLAVSVWRSDYASDVELMSAPGLYVRINKLKAALVQIQDILRARGWFG